MRDLSIQGRKQVACRDENHYARYMSSPHWLAVWHKAKRQMGDFCHVCGSIDHVQIHHLIYRHPWSHARRQDLIPVCEGCHKTYHGNPWIHQLVCKRKDLIERRQAFLSIMRGITPKTNQLNDWQANIPPVVIEEKYYVLFTKIKEGTKSKYVLIE